MNKTISVVIQNLTPECDAILRKDLQIIANTVAEALVGQGIFLGETMKLQVKVAAGDTMESITSEAVEVGMPKVYKNKYSDMFESKLDERGIPMWMPKPGEEKK